MNIKLLTSFLFVLVLVSTGSYMTLSFAQTSPLPTVGGSSGSSNNTNASSTSMNSRPNLANQLLKTNAIPNLLEKISSLSNIVGVSTVKGIKFSGISIGDANLTVTLKRQTNETNELGAATTANISSPPVTVIVSKLPVHNLTEVVSMLQAVRNMEGAVGNLNPSSASTIDLGTLLASNPGVQENLVRMISVLKNVQIGVGAIAKPNWALPQPITLRLIGLPASQVASASDTTDVILVTVVPYRGVLGNLAATP